MAFTASSLVVRIAADITDLNRKLTAAEKSVLRSARKIEGAGEKLTMAVTLPFVAMSAALAKGAADDAASLKKMGRAFGTATADMERWVSQMMKAVPATDGEIRQLAVSVNTMLRSMGMGAQSAQQMTRAIGQLAADLAAFTPGATIEGAADALGKALAGKTRGLMQFGVAIDDADVRAKAYAMGIGKLKGELSDSARIQATWALILDRTKAQQGEAARTAGDAANAHKFFMQALDELADTAGGHVLPAFDRIVRGLTSMVKWFTELPAGVRTTTFALGALAAVVGPMMKLVGVVARLGVALKGLSIASVLTNPVTMAIAALGGLAYWLYRSGDASRKAKQDIDSYTASLNLMNLAQLTAEAGRLATDRRTINAALSTTPTHIRAGDGPGQNAGFGSRVNPARSDLEARLRLNNQQQTAVASALGAANAMSVTPPGLPGLLGLSGGKSAFDRMVDEMRDMLALQEAMKEARMSTVAIEERIFAAYQRINAELARGASLSDGQLAAAIQLKTALGGAMGTRPAAVGITPIAGGNPTANIKVKGSRMFDSKDQYGNKILGSFSAIPVKLADNNVALKAGLEGVKSALLSGLSMVTNALLVGGGGRGSQIGGALGGAFGAGAGGVIGAKLGATVLGMAMPGIGTVIGTLAGSLLGGLFDKKKKVASGLDMMATQLERVNQQLRNVPSGYKIARLQHDSTFVGMDPDAGKWSEPRPGWPSNPKGGGNTYNITVVSNDPDDMLRKIERKVGSVATRGGTTRLKQATA